MEDSPQQSYTAAVGFFSHLNHTKQMALVLTRVSWLHLSQSSSQNKHCHRCTRTMYIQIPSELAFPCCFSLCGLVGICLWWKFPGTPATGTLTGCVFLHPSSCLLPSSLLLSAASITTASTLLQAQVCAERSHEWWSAASLSYPVSVASATMYNPPGGISLYQKMLISGF